MAANRASNSRFMGWGDCAAAMPDIRRRKGITTRLPLPILSSQAKSIAWSNFQNYIDAPGDWL